MHPEQLLRFTFSQIIDKWATTAPLLLRFLTTTANVSLESTSNLAGASLLRQQRIIHMSALHHIAGLILFHGNATKLVKCTYVYYAFSFHMKFYKLNLES